MSILSTRYQGSIRCKGGNRSISSGVCQVPQRVGLKRSFARIAAMLPLASSRPARLLEDAGCGLRFLAALPRYLRRPLTPDEARREMRQMLATRAADFLYLARRVIYPRPDHPLLRLLTISGCEYGDLAGLVGKAGLEGALSELYRRGVYLTVEEF